MMTTKAMMTPRASMGVFLFGAAIKRTGRLFKPNARQGRAIRRADRTGWRQRTGSLGSRAGRLHRKNTVYVVHIVHFAPAGLAADAPQAGPRSDGMEEYRSDPDPRRLGAVKWASNPGNSRDWEVGGTRAGALARSVSGFPAVREGGCRPDKRRGRGRRRRWNPRRVRPRDDPRSLQDRLER